MIITQFKGRLGNQLFEYAAARKFALDGKTELKIDLRNWGTKLDLYGLQFFNIIDNRAAEKECERLQNKGLLYYLEKFLPYYRRRFVWEKDFMFDPHLVGIQRKNMYVRGQFQSYKYFKGIEDILKKEFTLKYPFEKMAEDMRQKITSQNNSTSVHLRRGDYVSGEITSYISLPLSYYETAMQRVLEKYPDAHFFISSDDIAWVTENFPKQYPVTFLSSNEIPDYEELILMSLCKHNIIANSTFSWWGAYLNSNPDKVVMTPKNWFKDSSKNDNELIPKEWIKI